MANLLELSKDDDVITTIKSEIKSSWKREDVSYINDKYFTGGFFPTSFDVAKDLGYVKDNVVTDVRHMNTTSWTVMAVRSAIDIFTKLELAGTVLTNQIKGRILDQEYENKVHDIAINWAPFRKNNKR